MLVHPRAIVVIVVKCEYINSYKLDACLDSKDKLDAKIKTSHLPNVYLKLFQFTHVRRANKHNPSIHRFGVNWQIIFTCVRRSQLLWYSFDKKPYVGRRRDHSDRISGNELYNEVCPLYFLGLSYPMESNVQSHLWNTNSNLR